MESRRESLKIIGAIGATCAFPFAADELYGQHAHPPSRPPAVPEEPFQPMFFKKAEYQALSRLADLIIPPTGTPGAVGAGVPRYIDQVVSANAEHRTRFRAGLRWLDRESKKRFGKRFVRLTEERQTELLAPLSQAVDARRARTAPEHFFRVVKNMTADGYYTSRTGLVEELGYAGNTVLAQFPECLHEH
ncbi:MAG: gluconate 2-dehydrogenase subunit 3 family protein [Acidobacteria bacterium]|nr:gluconate 2-dehydrogenase subunit 3 family protein [Acidobacteriota bacterium]MBI3473765.1 gluconate 2-dehydrogenase subunit 3 family protein [Candidatus Solibacter usitatus]